MTNKQAIEMITAHKRCIERRTSGDARHCNYDCDYCSLNYARGNMGEIKEWCELAIEALEKQIPKIPDYEDVEYDDSGNIDYGTWICPNCNNKFEAEFEHYEYCPNCGQAIDWS